MDEFDRSTAVVKPATIDEDRPSLLPLRAYDAGVATESPHRLAPCRRMPLLATGFALEIRTFLRSGERIRRKPRLRIWSCGLPGFVV
ncbi:hypothetical protein [Jiella avicenniae]|uniref:Uncharacterized protein n=1 Tax=Jiella avicenniae TaxID=2907202 RepID=A0A9X1T7J5_9HYPH|nr:hypothetical protein [Jiella avicenniae]MCE7030490.1 hypothetical protein [Jiella avicenniae]